MDVNIVLFLAKKSRGAQKVAKGRAEGAATAYFAFTSMLCLVWGNFLQHKRSSDDGCITLKLRTNHAEATRKLRGSKAESRPARPGPLMAVQKSLQAKVMERFLVLTDLPTRIAGLRTKTVNYTAEGRAEGTSHGRLRHEFWTTPSCAMKSQCTL